MYPEGRGHIRPDRKIQEGPAHNSGTPLASSPALPTVCQYPATSPAIKEYQAPSVQSSYLKSPFWLSQAHPKLS